MYNKLVKHVIFPLHEKILGRKTCSFLNELQALQYLSPDRLEILKFEKLKQLLIHAEKNIPFYTKRFAEAGFNPEKMREIADIKVLPLLSKAQIRRNLDDMTWKNCPGGLYRYNTGGSSGKPLVFYFDRRRQAWDAAARALTHQWWGVDIGDRELYLWGSPVETTRQDRIKDIRDRLTNELLVSAFDLSEEKIPDMVAQFRKFKPACVFGYPSSITLFCELAARQGFQLDDLGIRMVFSTAEVLYDHQRETMGRFFGNVPVADCYGSREGGFVCHQCEKGAYHLMEPNYIMEYVDENGAPAGDGGGEVVLTHLDAWGMPFIRYRTGDVASPGSGGCTCGRTWATIKDIKGRTTDFIVTPDGRYQHALSLIYIIRDIEGVDQFKIIQHRVDDIEVQLTVDETLFPATGDAQIIRGIHKRVGTDVTVSVHRRQSIPLDASGKYRYVVSHVN